MLECLEAVLPADHILRDEPMEKHTTFRIGGPADALVTVDTESQLCAVAAALRRVGVPFFLLGNGSNLLVADTGYRGVAVRLGGAFRSIRRSGRNMWAGAGAMLGELAGEAMEQGLSGLEFAFGIPGTVGGAVRMNAGAYGGELSRVVTCARVLDAEGSVQTVDAGRLEFGYRQSGVPRKGWIVLGAAFSLREGRREEIAARMQEFSRRRKEKQPLEYPSAGSAFKRPQGHFAGQLIEEAGLRGRRVGDAQISEKHCGFIVNRGRATAADVRRLMRETQQTVLEKSGVWLEPEPVFLGSF